MNILITGGAGYVGGALTDQLSDLGHNVKVYDCLLYEESFRKDVEFIFGDIRDTEKLAPLLKWADVVVWLAAFVGDGACAINPEVSDATNNHAVKWLADNFDGRIIFPSTCSVYGAQEGVLSESSPTNPLSVYATTKLAAEQHLLDKDALIFRLGTLFGVGDQYARIRLDLVVNVLTVNAAVRGELSVFGGEQFRPLLHVKDVANAMIENLNSGYRGIFNLHRQNVRIVDVASQIRNHFPDAVIHASEMKFQDARNYRVSSDKARDILGWRSRWSIDDGIEEVKELIMSRRLKDVLNPRYTNQLFLSRFVPNLEKLNI
jgi:nucleoside-diphosphate-sugar epimerase